MICFTRQSNQPEPASKIWAVARSSSLPLSTTSNKMAAQPNGTVEAPIDVSGLPTVVGINFGNSYASIAVLNKVWTME